MASKRTAPRGEIVLQYASPRTGLPSPASVSGWARTALERPARITVRFVGEAEGRRLNREYRGRDYATNVLTFAYPAESKGEPLSGDIVLCAPVIAREAREQGKTPRQHCAHLVVHGVLHLQGFDHETGRAAVRMEARERTILARLGYPDPYAVGESQAQRAGRRPKRPR